MVIRRLRVDDNEISKNSKGNREIVDDGGERVLCWEISSFHSVSQVCFANLRFRVHIHHVCIPNMYIITLIYHCNRIIYSGTIFLGAYILIQILKTYSCLFYIWFNFRKFSLTLLPPSPYNYALVPKTGKPLLMQLQVMYYYITLPDQK